MGEGVKEDQKKLDHTFSNAGNKHEKIVSAKDFEDLQKGKLGKDSELVKALEQDEDVVSEHTHHHLSPEALWTFMMIIFFSQIMIFFWKKKHRKSFFMVTLAGLWLFPVVSCFTLHWWRFVCVWLIVSCSLIYLVFKSSRSQLDGNIPSMIYKFFYSLYRVTSFLSGAGYALVVMEIFGVGLIWGIPLAPAGIMMLGYGLYFGVLFRDWAEICTDLITSNIGYYSKDGIPRRQCRYNQCGICDKPLFNDIRDHAKKDKKPLERTYKMQCGHIVHEFCIRGWCIIGKKDTCPVCREKVSISDVFKTHWHKQDRVWAQLLDAIRYLVVWNPIIIFGGKFVISHMGVPMVVEHTTKIHHHIRGAIHGVHSH